MGLLDKAKKLAEQAKEKAELVKEKAEEALAEVKARQDTTSSSPPSPPKQADPRLGTAYVAGMLGSPGWRERGLTDPAALLPIADRDQAGIPHSTKSEIVEEPYGMGRRWTSGERSAGLFYRLTPGHRAWTPPGGAAPDPEVAGATAAALDDGRMLHFLSAASTDVVLETRGLDDRTRAALVTSVRL
jgi:hypothetical protein